METVKMLEMKMQTCIRELDGLTDTDAREAKIEEIKILGQTLKELKQVEYNDENECKNYGLRLEQMENEAKAKKIDQAIGIAGLVISAATAVGVFVADSKGVLFANTNKQCLMNWLPKWKK